MISPFGLRDAWDYRLTKASHAAPPKSSNYISFKSEEFLPDTIKRSPIIAHSPTFLIDQ